MGGLSWKCLGLFDWSWMALQSKGIGKQPETVVNMDVSIYQLGYRCLLQVPIQKCWSTGDGDPKRNAHVFFGSGLKSNCIPHASWHGGMDDVTMHHEMAYVHSQTFSHDCIALRSLPLGRNAKVHPWGWFSTQDGSICSMIHLIFEPNIRTPTISVYANMESSHGFILTFVQVACGEFWLVQGLSKKFDVGSTSRRMDGWSSRPMAGRRALRTEVTWLWRGAIPPLGTVLVELMNFWNYVWSCLRIGEFKPLHWSIPTFLRQGASQ